MTLRRFHQMSSINSFPGYPISMRLSDATSSTFSKPPATIANAPPKFSASTARHSIAWPHGSRLSLAILLILPNDLQDFRALAFYRNLDGLFTEVWMLAC